jgi:hypothetical protein
MSWWGAGGLKTSNATRVTTPGKTETIITSPRVPKLGGGNVLEATHVWSPACLAMNNVNSAANPTLDAVRMNGAARTVGVDSSLSRCIAPCTTQTMNVIVAARTLTTEATSTHDAQMLAMAIANRTTRAHTL